MNKMVRRLAFFPIVFASLCAAGPGVIPLSSLKLNGRAYLLSDGYVRLTRNSNQASSAFVPTPFSLGPNDSFAALFVYQSQQELGQCVADGLAFVAQNTPAGPSYLGESGSGLGFFTGTVSPAIGVTFDYYPNQKTGTPANAAAIATPDGVDLVWTTPTPPALTGPGAFRYVWVTYRNTSRIMKVFYSAALVPPATALLETTLPADLSSLFGGQVYFGVTAGTGSCYSRQFLIYLALDVVNLP
jgi:hypothetical protein